MINIFSIKMNDKSNQSSEQDTIMEFPCRFPIKVMGKAMEDFDSLVVGIIRNHVDDLTEGAVTTRASKAGNYLSVTVVIEANSKQQLDNIYMELSAHEKVIMAL